MQENKIILNKEQSHIVHDFFRKHGDKNVWTADEAIYKMIEDVLAAHFVFEEEGNAHE